MNLGGQCGFDLGLLVAQTCVHPVQDLGFGEVVIGDEAGFVRVVLVGGGATLERTAAALGRGLATPSDVDDKTVVQDTSHVLNGPSECDLRHDCFLSKIIHNKTIFKFNPRKKL